MPHGHCYLWQPLILWLNVISDFIIVLAYYCIPFLLAFIVYRSKIHHQFNTFFLLFSIFILACGTTHLMEVVNVWHTEYLLAGIIKAITAIASLLTALVLIKISPEIIRMLKKANEPE